MISFKRCYPDANNFNDIIKLKSVKDWKADYVQLDKDIGYWIVENPFVDNGVDYFRDVVNCFPIQKNNSQVQSTQPNPFDTIHVPEWVHKDLCLSVRDFYLDKVQRDDIVDPQVHEWGNVYFKSVTKPISCWRIPHIDYTFGMVANLWFTDHDVSDSCTKIYKYHGEVKDTIYDFQIDPAHRMHEEWKSLSEHAVKHDGWFNSDDKDLERWGFEYLGSAPTKEKTLTMYMSNICHTPFISDKVNFRWSHTFAFSHLVGQRLNLSDYIKI